MKYKCSQCKQGCNQLNLNKDTKKFVCNDCFYGNKDGKVKYNKLRQVSMNITCRSPKETH